jgi:hypothetical protein
MIQVDIRSDFERVGDHADGTTPFWGVIRG